ncbi:MAG: phosphatase PAP2 family protein [Desulfobacterales bacterium]|nr:MAG: phosphatase PAP2 family protein [Desulfobacterales bacterium]
MNTNKKVIWDFGIPLLILFGFTFVFWFTDVDILLSSCFYSSEKGWFLKRKEPWNFLYRYGGVPGITLGLASLAAIGVSFISIRVRPYRKAAIFLVVVLALGPGLVTGFFKETWGRPRPRKIENFGGPEQFLPVWKMGTSGRFKSFPSSHASIGFYLFAPYFVLRRTASTWARFSLSAGIIYGTLMGIGRIAQGGHFASDVLWAAGFTYLTGLVLCYAFRFDTTIPRRGHDPIISG